MKTLNEYEIRIQLGKSIASQGIGNNFSHSLEKRIVSLRKKLDKI